MRTKFSTQKKLAARMVIRDMCDRLLMLVELDDKVEKYTVFLAIVDKFRIQLGQLQRAAGKFICC
jgi:hypothetical protein